MHASKDKNDLLFFNSRLSSIILHIIVLPRIILFHLDNSFWDCLHRMESESFILFLVLLAFYTHGNPFEVYETEDPNIPLIPTLRNDSTINYHFLIDSCCTMVSSCLGSSTKVNLLIPSFGYCVKCPNVVETLAMVFFFTVFLLTTEEVKFLLESDT